MGSHLNVNKFFKYIFCVTPLHHNLNAINGRKPLAKICRCHTFQGETNRAIAEHTLNKHSSRSHCIFTIYIEVNIFLSSVQT